MFNKQNFCHIASNNRNEVKTGVFVYKTTDDLQTVLTSGYFNEKIVDINLHDLIVHEWHDPADRTNVEYNLLCVTERTLDNVGTSLIMSDWEKGVEETIAGLDDKYVKKTGDTMTGPLRFGTYGSIGERPGGSDTGTGITISYYYGGQAPWYPLVDITNKGISPVPLNTKMALGNQAHPWKKLYIKEINNGYDLTVPAKSGTLATIEDVNDALANAGSSLTSKGVWYAKMYAGTTAPAAEDGTNYADFSQTDGQGNPIIVIYERQNGAWVQTDTITPPANYNGYVMVTSKIWDIPEQSGQQGGQVNWDCVHKTFTPYPKIISFEDAALTGNSTVQMPSTPTSDSIVNKGYVDSAIAASSSANDLFDTKWKDYLMNNPAWALSDGNWKTSTAGYRHLLDDVLGSYRLSYWGTNWYTKSRTPEAGDSVWGSGSTSVQPYGTVESYDPTTDSIVVDGVSYAFTSYTIDSNADHQETIAGTTVHFYLTADGHKICPASQETHVNAIYAATGIAWYYIIDTTNQRFKLPRTQYAFVNTRTAVGAYVEPSAPNITAGAAGVLIVNTDQGTSGAFTYTAKAGNNFDNTGGAGEARANLNLNASLSSDVYKNGATIQQPATEMYLYFYIGQ